MCLSNLQYYENMKKTVLSFVLLDTVVYGEYGFAVDVPCDAAVGDVLTYFREQTHLVGGLRQGDVELEGSCIQKC